MGHDPVDSKRLVYVQTAKQNGSVIINFVCPGPFANVWLPVCIKLYFNTDKSLQRLRGLRGQAGGARRIYVNCADSLILRRTAAYHSGGARYFFGGEETFPPQQWGPIGTTFL